MAGFYHINHPDAVIDEHADDDEEEDVDVDVDVAFDVCGCGCELQFSRFRIGLGIYIGEEWLMAERELLAYKWSDYLSPNHCKTWGDLEEYITTNFNNAQNNLYVPENAPWYHLYNILVRKFDKYPLNGVLNYVYE
jgi:hypothetical protein